MTQTRRTRSGAWVEITPGSPSQAPPRAGRDRDRSSHASPNCPKKIPALAGISSNHVTRRPN